MAKKTRKQKQRAATRRPAAPRPPTAPQQRWDLPGASGASVASVATEEPLAEAEGDLDAISDGEEPVAAAPVAAPAGAAPAGAPRRRIERLSQAAPARPARGRGPANAAAMFQPLDSEDAAIPFDRVPYVPSDLRRVAIMAAFMVGLIIIAAIVVTHVVQ